MNDDDNRYQRERLIRAGLARSLIEKYRSRQLPDEQGPSVGTEYFRVMVRAYKTLLETQGKPDDAGSVYMQHKKFVLSKPHMYSTKTLEAEMNDFVKAIRAEYRKPHWDPSIVENAEKIKELADYHIAITELKS